MTKNKKIKTNAINELILLAEYKISRQTTKSEVN